MIIITTFYHTHTYGHVPKLIFLEVMVDNGTRGGKRLTLPAELERDRVLLITTQYLHI